MADLTPDLHIFLSWGLIAESFHSLQFLSVSCFHVILGLPGPRFLSTRTCMWKAVLTAPLGRSTCPYQQSLLSFRMRSRSSMPSHASSSLDLVVTVSCSLMLQICLIIALSFRCRRWRFGFVNGQVSLAWSIALRTQELYTWPRERGGMKRELVAAPWTSSRRFSHVLWLKVHSHLLLRACLLGSKRKLPPPACQIQRTSLCGLDQVFWLAENKKWVWHFNLFSMTMVKYWKPLFTGTSEIMTAILPEETRFFSSFVCIVLQLIHSCITVLAPDNIVFFLFVLFSQPKSINFSLISPREHMMWCSLKVTHWGASNEYPQHMFSCRNKKNKFWILYLSRVMIAINMLRQNSVILRKDVILKRHNLEKDKRYSRLIVHVKRYWEDILVIFTPIFKLFVVESHSFRQEGYLPYIFLISPCKNMYW